MAHWLAHRLAALRLPHPRGLIVEAVTIRRPSELKVAALTELSWRIGSPTGLPLSASHTRAVLSKDAVTTRRPSGLKLAATTVPSWRIGSPTGLPLSTSQTRAVSPDVVTTNRPSALKLAANTAL